ncbi:hypothetical protein BS639_17965 [Rouxiella silvae]|uniref:Phage portal protein n=1 Tax=Rouxiella silvae TaxID=1646373 RepID=A0ABX3TXF2_9GAMM|nr:hypothetical protein [Rouxiella silvae]ORJ19878.1 hypothetical protein BS639_17965 [Rouxiella silvae]
MNERELSLIKHMGEVFFSHISDINIQFNKALQEHMTLVGEKLASMGEELHVLAKATPPDFKGMIAAAVSTLPEPAAPKLPDIEKMVQGAVSRIELPVAPELPDIEKMVADVIGRIELPVAPELPDIERMVQDAVSRIELPVAPELPDIEKMVADAIGRIELPELPDIEKMVKEQVSASVSALPEVHNGADGKDALQLEVLPGINEEKSYPRGTYALFKGGLWRAYQKTMGLSGWECVVSGVHSIDVIQNAQREFSINLSLSDGVMVEKTFSVPVLIYRGVFKNGEGYQPGDTVTWGGSLWHCDDETADKPGEIGSKGWTLAAKRGRDGKDK